MSLKTQAGMEKLLQSDLLAERYGLAPNIMGQNSFSVEAMLKDDDNEKYVGKLFPQNMWPNFAIVFPLEQSTGTLGH